MNKKTWVIYSSDIGSLLPKLLKNINPNIQKAFSISKKQRVTIADDDNHEFFSMNIW